jgi:hypothetical protein
VGEPGRQNPSEWRRVWVSEKFWVTHPVTKYLRGNITGDPSKRPRVTQARGTGAQVPQWGRVIDG